MKLFIDTNVFLEILLDQERSLTAQQLLEKVSEHEFFVSDYSLHSIGLILFQRSRHSEFQQFLSDMIIEGGAEVLSLSVSDLDQLVSLARGIPLDFDDAYQYALAEKHDLTIVSFDRDFDKTKKGRKAPTEIGT